MSRKTQNNQSIGDKIVYDVDTPNGWSIVIMPDNILIDNYHIGKAHIYPDSANHSYKINLKTNDHSQIKEIISDYINFSPKFDVEELVELLT